MDVDWTQDTAADDSEQDTADSAVVTVGAGHSRLSSNTVGAGHSRLSSKTFGAGHRRLSSSIFSSRNAVLFCKVILLNFKVCGRARETQPQIINVIPELLFWRGNFPEQRS